MRLGSLSFLNKKGSVILIFHLNFCAKFTVVYVYWPIIWKLQLTWQNANIRFCTYPLLTLVQSLSPTAFMPIILKHFVLSIF